MNIFYYDVAVDIPVRQCFTYKSISKIKKGTRVTVPFGKKTLIGIVIKVSSISTSIVKTSAIKEIISVDDQYICFKKPLFNTLLWASEYYHHPIGEVFLSFLPSILRKQTNKSIINIDETSNYKINSTDVSFSNGRNSELLMSANFDVNHKIPHGLAYFQIQQKFSRDQQGSFGGGIGVKFKF